MRVLLTGAAGQLGATLATVFARSATLVPCSRAELDITDRAGVSAAVTSQHPDVIVNCAAYTDVDWAEDDPMTAFDVNAMSVLSLAEAAAGAGAIFVHYSTDFVFDGASDRPYLESDTGNPASLYGLSKLFGEWLAATAPRHYVLRVESLFGGPHGKASIDRILDAIAAGEPARVFVDRTVTPSYVVDVAAATARLIESSAPFGLYHCVNSGVTTWYDVAREAQKLLGRNSTLVPVRVDDVPLRAKRPRYCALSNEKLAAAGIRMPAWQDALARHIAVRDG